MGTWVETLFGDGGVMRRYLTLLFLFWESSIAAVMAYRTNFLVSTLVTLLSMIGNLFGLSLFYRGPTQLGGWSYDEALLVLGCFTMLNGFSSTILIPNLSRIVRHVERGTLDFVLLRPVDSQFSVSLSTVSPFGLADVLVGLGMIGYASTHLDIATPAYALGLVPLLLACVSLYAMWFMLATTSIWFVKIYNATEVLKGLLDAGRFPISAFAPAHRFVFTFIVPIAFLTTVPAEMVLGRAGYPLILASCAIACGLFIVSRRFWFFALRFYTSASS